MLGLFSRNKKQETFLTWQDMVKDQGEFVQQIERDMKNTLSKYGRFEGGIFYMNTTLPLVTMREVVEYQKKVLKTTREILSFLEDGEQEQKKMNAQAIKTRKELLAMTSDVSELPIGIVKLYRLDEEIDERRYL
jgi:hypothetical protein